MRLDAIFYAIAEGRRVILRVFRFVIKAMIPLTRPRDMLQQWRAFSWASSNAMLKQEIKNENYNNYCINIIIIIIKII